MCASPKVSEMSLWGAVPLHPRDRRTQGSVGGDCWTSRGGTCGRWRAGGPPSSQEGEPASEKIAQRHLGRFVGEPRRLRPCLTAPTAVTPASAVLLPLASRYPHIPCLLNTLGWWKRARLPCSAPGSSVGKEVALYLAGCSPTDSRCGICSGEVPVAKPSSHHKPPFPPFLAVCLISATVRFPPWNCLGSEVQGEYHRT